jgi:hypothetical protein
VEVLIKRVVEQMIGVKRVVQGNGSLDNISINHFNGI